CVCLPVIGCRREITHGKGGGDGEVTHFGEGATSSKPTPYLQMTSRALVPPSVGDSANVEARGKSKQKKYAFLTRRELSYFGVKVAIVEPGGFKTALNDRHSSIIKMLWDQASSEVKEVYGDKFLQSYLRTLTSLVETCSEDLTLVTDCMEHALTSCHPRTRYSAGWDAKLLYLPMSYLPTFLSDAFFYW
ncbi:retinol dehydrogenase 7-like, partial [Microtus ochrogaster]|uniref:Retinol dehydrogenase 7-like n=1 Tax=Microtus ochrogaster TaxID=79684 RepID=A0ABM1TX94_MICOH